MMPVEISAALMPFVNVKQEHILRGNLRPKVNLRVIVACVGVGAESQANSKADYAENRCTWYCQQVLGDIRNPEAIDEDS